MSFYYMLGLFPYSLPLLKKRLWVLAIKSDALCGAEPLRRVAPRGICSGSGGLNCHAAFAPEGRSYTC